MPLRRAPPRRRLVKFCTKRFRGNVGGVCRDPYVRVGALSAACERVPAGLSIAGERGSRSSTAAYFPRAGEDPGLADGELIRRRAECAAASQEP
jgi:hypothetical protein